jgi:hypothetical protein
VQAIDKKIESPHHAKNQGGIEYGAAQPVIGKREDNKERECEAYAHCWYWGFILSLCLQSNTF